MDNVIRAKANRKDLTIRSSYVGVVMCVYEYHAKNEVAKQSTA
jgi:hypothetical protein